MNAVNQQESLLITENVKWFLAGLIEGEGSVCVSFKNHPTARFGYYVDPEFFIYQHENARDLLELAKRVFGTGRIAPKPGNEVVLVYSIVSRRSLVEQVIPFYEQYMVYASKYKQENFKMFKAVVDIMINGGHHTKEGMLKIVDLAYSLNHAGKQRKRPKQEVIDRILRDSTPNSEEPTEKIESELCGDTQSGAEMTRPPEPSESNNSA